MKESILGVVYLYGFYVLGHEGTMFKGGTGELHSLNIYIWNEGEHR